MFDINDLQRGSKTLYIVFGPVFSCDPWRCGHRSAYKPHKLFLGRLATRVAELAIAPRVGLAMRSQGPAYVCGQKIALLFFSTTEISTPGESI